MQLMREQMKVANGEKMEIEGVGIVWMHLIKWGIFLNVKGIWFP